MSLQSLKPLVVNQYWPELIKHIEENEGRIIEQLINSGNEVHSAELRGRIKAYREILSLKVRIEAESKK